MTVQRRGLATMKKNQAKEMPVNTQIQANKVRVVDAHGTNHGVLKLNAAIALAVKEGLDLVQVGMVRKPAAHESKGDDLSLEDTEAMIPICKILDSKKYLYNIQKRQQEQKRKMKVMDRSQEVKGIQFGSSIGDHDFGIKCKQMIKFLSNGHTTRLAILFRRSGGKTLEARRTRGFEMLERCRHLVEEYGHELEDQRKVLPGYLRTVFAPRKRGSLHSK